MKIPVFYELEWCGDDYYSALACSNCQTVVYDDRIGWMDDPDESGKSEHRHPLGYCRTYPEPVHVFRYPSSLDEIPM